MIESNTTKLTVIRHGQTRWNLEARQQGQLDNELIELGVRQAQAIADTLDNNRFEALYSSDLSRAVQTAEIIAQKVNLKVLTDSRLREWHLGILQGLTFPEFQQKYHREYVRFQSGDPDYIIPGGESVRQRHQRCITCANELAQQHPGKQIIIITHGRILDSFLINTLDLPLTTTRNYSNINASINIFTISKGQWKLESWGNVHHLNDMEITHD